MEPWLIQLIGLTFGTTVALAFVGLKAYGMWIGRRVTDLDSQKVAELETRIAELEERADFAERLLADARRPREVPRPADTPV